MRLKYRPNGGQALAIKPSLTHYNVSNPPLFVASTLAFLDDGRAD